MVRFDTIARVDKRKVGCGEVEQRRREPAVWKRKKTIDENTPHWSVTMPDDSLSSKRERKGKKD